MHKKSVTRTHFYHNKINYSVQKSGYTAESFAYCMDARWGHVQLTKITYKDA